MSNFCNQIVRRIFTLGLVLMAGCGGGESDLAAHADDPGLPSEIRELLDSKRMSAMGREAVTDLNLDLGVVKRAIKQVRESNSDSPFPFSEGDFSLIKNGIEERKNQTIDRLVLDALSEEEMQSIRQNSPQLLSRLQASKTKHATLDDRREVLAERIDALTKKAESNESVKAATEHAMNVANDIKEEDSMQQREIAMSRAAQGARSVDEMIEMQVQALSDQLDQQAELISAESSKRFSVVHIETHRIVWKQLTDIEKTSVGELLFDYVTKTQEQFAAYQKTRREPAASKVETKLPTYADLRIAFANQINTEINSHNNSLSRAHRVTLGGVIEMSEIDQDLFDERTANEELKLMVKIHGPKLARPLAELCFDTEKRIQSRAVKMIKSLGEPAIGVLTSDELPADEAKLCAYAVLKSFDNHDLDLKPDDHWAEMLGETRFANIALSELADILDPIELNSKQMQFVRNGIRAGDHVRCQNCLAIARHAVKLDGETLDAIERKSHSKEYLGQRSLELLAKHGRGEKIRKGMIAELAEQRTNSGYGRQETERDAVNLAARIVKLEPLPAELEPLVQRLAEPGEGFKVREAIAKIFSDAGGESVNPIAAMLSSGLRKDQRIELLKSLGLIKTASPAALKELIRWVQQGDDQERKAAINSLSRIGKEARSAVDPLLAATNDRKTGSDAMRAVAAILEDPDDANLRKVVLYLGAKNDYVSRYAADILIKAGPKAKAVLPDVIRASQSGPLASAAKILGAIGEASPEVVTRLIQMTGQRSSFTRQPAIKSLGQLGPEAKAAVPTLVKIVSSQRDNKERYLAIWSLIQINEKTPALISVLKEIYNKRGPREYQRFTAVALIHFGESAQTYERDLHYLLENSVNDAGVPFKDLAAEQMLELDPDNRLAKDRLERNRRSKEIGEKLNLNRW